MTITEPSILDVVVGVAMIAACVIATLFFIYDYMSG
jgi:hypothetical protein